MEAPHPLLQPAVVGVHVVDVEIWRLRLWRAGCGQDMELDPGAPSEGGDRRASIAAQFGWPGNDLPERGCLRGWSQRHVLDLLRALEGAGLVEASRGEYPTIATTKRGDLVAIGRLDAGELGVQMPTVQRKARKRSRA